MLKADMRKKALTVQEAGRMGGKARAKALSKQRASAIGRKAARARWDKKENR
jgi:general stress protein YciG